MEDKRQSQEEPIELFDTYTVEEIQDRRELLSSSDTCDSLLYACCCP